MSLYDFADTVDWQGAGFDTTGDWVLGSGVPSTGDNGPGLAYNDLEATDLAKEVCVRITTPPSIGTLYVYPDTSFIYTRPSDGTSVAQYQFYLNRVPVGSPQNVSLTVGSGAATAPGATLTGLATFTGGGAYGPGGIPATAPGMTLTAIPTFEGGAAIASINATAPGATLTGESIFTAGSAFSLTSTPAPASRTMKVGADRRTMKVSR